MTNLETSASETPNDLLILDTNAAIETLRAGAETGTGEKPKWVPTTEDDLLWILRTIANRRAEAKRILENAKIMAGQLEQRAHSLEFLYGEHLEAYAAQLIKANGRKGD